MGLQLQTTPSCSSDWLAVERFCLGAAEAKARPSVASAARLESTSGREREREEANRHTTHSYDDDDDDGYSGPRAVGDVLLLVVAADDGRTRRGADRLSSCCTGTRIFPAPSAKRCTMG